MTAVIVDPTGLIGEMERQRDEMRAPTTMVLDPLRAMVDVSRSLAVDPLRTAVGAFPKVVLREAIQLPLAVRELRRRGRR